MNKKYNILYLILLCFFLSCIDKHFIIYSVAGDELKYDEAYKSSNSISDFKLYFNKDEIDQDYLEINTIATNYFYYGQFFFDKNFMTMLKNRTIYIGADALIYNIEKKDFPNYNDDYLYFTAIKYVKN